VKVILLKDVPNIGQAGEVKEVAVGYGRNYLIPKKLAVLATPAALKEFEQERRAEISRQLRSDVELAEFARTLEGLSITIKARAGSEGRLYGSITSADIAQELRRITGYEIDKRKIELEEPLRKLGSHRVAVRLSKDRRPSVEVIIEEERG